MGFLEDVENLKATPSVAVPEEPVHKISGAKPISGQVYKAPNGRPMIYVRTEQRPNAKGPEHFFIEARDRIVCDRWVPVGMEPPELLVETIA